MQILSGNPSSSISLYYLVDIHLLQKVALYMFIYGQTDTKKVKIAEKLSKTTNLATLRIFFLATLVAAPHLYIIYKALTSDLLKK